MVAAGPESGNCSFLLDTQHRQQTPAQTTQPPHRMHRQASRSALERTFRNLLPTRESMPMALDTWLMSAPVDSHNAESAFTEEMR